MFEQPVFLPSERDWLDLCINRILDRHPCVTYTENLTTAVSLRKL